MTNRWYFSYFSQKTGSDISCKLSPLETICMKCRILFYRKKKKKKNISQCRLLKCLPKCHVFKQKTFVGILFNDTSTLLGHFVLCGRKGRKKNRGGVHDKNYNKIMGPGKTQISLHIHAVWSVFADHICLLQPPCYSKRDKREPLPYWVMYRLIWVFVGHTGLIVGFLMRWLRGKWKKETLTLVLLNPDMSCLCRQCRSRSVGFFRSQLIWICTVCHKVC